jgi:hypothetical protein
MLATFWPHCFVAAKPHCGSDVGHSLYATEGLGEVGS